MDKFSYAIGLGIGQNLSSMGIQGLAVDDFAQAIRDVLEGNQTAISHNEAREIVNKYFEELETKMGAVAIEQGQAFLEENKKGPGVVVLPSGLQYEIIKEALLERIRTGQFSSDAVFCTEKMLSEQYEVSRITAKRAIEDLEQQGILYRKRGVGSFVSQKIPPVSSSASETDSKSKMVSLLLPFATTQGNISETIGSLSAALAEKGYFLSIHITGSSSPKERATLELLRSQNIAGLVYYPKRDNIHLEQLNDFPVSYTHLTLPTILRV